MTVPHPIERLAAVFCAAACIVITILVWRSVSSSQNTWPFPALYFLELMLLGMAVALAFLRPSQSRAVVAMAASGVLAAFSMLGAWTVGLVYVPAALAALIAGLAAEVRNKGSILAHAGVFLIAALAQAAVMLAMASMF